MAYIVIEATVARHRKFLKAGPSASWLWVCGLAYCQQGLTDGFIPKSALDFLGVRNAAKFVSKLVDSGLWEEHRDGWQMHDYLDHNKPANAVRDLMRKRAEMGKRGGRPKTNHENHDGFTSTKTITETKMANHPENPLLSSPSPSPSPSPGTSPGTSPTGRNEYTPASSPVDLDLPDSTSNPTGADAGIPSR